MNRRANRAVARELLNVLLIVLGILSASMGLHGFLFSSNFIDGGVTGISMLLAKVTGMPLSIWLPLVNLPFIALGYRLIGRLFAVRSALAIGGLAVSLAVLHFPDVTHDLVLTAVFGGFFIGAGIGLAVRGGAVLDGTEIAALLISRRSHVLKVGDVILLFNVVLFLVAMSVLGREEALYSILTYVAAARTLDFVINGIEDTRRSRSCRASAGRSAPESSPTSAAASRSTRAAGASAARIRKSCTAWSRDSRSAASSPSSGRSTRTPSSRRIPSPTWTAGW